jgi:acyl carrier protein
MAEMNAGNPPTAKGPSQEEILDFLRSIALEELELSEEQIEGMTLETSIVEGLRLDSVDQVVLVTAIEEHYDFQFDFEDGERVDTLKDLVEMIQKRIAAKGE